jgi:hypothetical protein
VPPVVSTKANIAQVPTQRLSASPPVAPSLPPAVTVSAPTADAFDPSAPPPASISATSAVAEPVPTPPQPASAPTATSAAASNGLEVPQPVPLVLPARPHSGIRLGDEDLNEDQQSLPHPEQKQVVEPAATQVTAEAHPPVAASPYEADRPPACVTLPSTPVRQPASTTVPPRPSATGDSWESTKASKSETPPREPSVPVPVPARATEQVFTPLDLTPRKHAPVLPDAMVTVPTHTPSAHSSATYTSATYTSATRTSATRTSATRTSATHTSTTHTSAVQISDAPIRAVAEQERVAAVKVFVDRPKTRGGSDPMICDSASVHGKYTGGEDPSPADGMLNPHDAAPEKPTGLVHPAAPGIPAAKKAPAPVGGKTTSFWDDPFASPMPTQRVSTADFTVPVPGPFDADDGRSIALKSAAASEQSASMGAARSRSRAWIAIGVFGGLAAIALVWRRRRHHDEPQLG